MIASKSLRDTTTFSIVFSSIEAFPRELNRVLFYCTESSPLSFLLSSNNRPSVHLGHFNTLFCFECEMTLLTSPPPLPRPLLPHTQAHELLSPAGVTTLGICRTFRKWGVIEESRPLGPVLVSIVVCGGVRIACRAFSLAASLPCFPCGCRLQPSETVSQNQSFSPEVGSVIVVWSQGK